MTGVTQAMVCPVGLNHAQGARAWRENCVYTGFIRNLSSMCIALLRSLCMKPEAPRAVRLKDYAPSAFLIDGVSLEFVLDATKTQVRARTKFRANPAVKGSHPLRLDGEGLDLEYVKLDGRLLLPTEFTRDDASLTLTHVPDKPFTLDIATVVNPSENKALQGLYVSKGIYCTQCEAQGFRRITYFLDRPDVLAKYTVRIESDIAEAATLLSNGNPQERGTLDRGKRHYAVWKDPHPKPSYLFALVGGNLSSIASTFRTKSGRDVDLRIYVEAGKEKRCAWAMDSLKRSMRWDEQRFGREYDLDVFNIVAVSDFNMGAMENKGLNIFNDRLVLASPETATDDSFEAIEAVVAHEYFHNWTGNRITCRDWFQLCLKEGLTVYRDQEFSADERSRTVQRIADVRLLKSRQFAEDAGPLAHPVRPDSYVEINNFYTATVYEKGAELVRMIQTIVGNSAFRDGLDLYFKRHDGQAATVEQFITCFEDATGVDLSQFAIWYAQAGTPQIVAQLSYDAKSRTASVTLEQVLPATPGETKKKLLHIPVRLGLIGADGRDLALKLEGVGPLEQHPVVHLKRRQQTFKFKDIDKRPVLSVLRGFSAPVNLTVNHSEAELAFLMRHDSDLYNRWHAAQDYALRALVKAVKTIRADGKPEKPVALIEALGAALADEKLEPAYRAQFMLLPTESDVARHIGRDIDPAAIHAAHTAIRRFQAQQLGPQLVEIYERMTMKQAYSPESGQAGQRALRNAAMRLLAHRKTAADTARAEAQFYGAKNATDEIAAFGALMATAGAVRMKALDTYFERWKDDHLMIETWFTMQAMGTGASTLSTVQKLMKHPLFSLKNPNKARNLIGGFAGNPVGFNRPDGKGYEFVAAQVLAIDAFNPQVASRILTSFRSWRSLEAGRRKLAKGALSAIAKHKSLSRDVHEIVIKTLE
jgi:aminopeptidase N